LTSSRNNGRVSFVHHASSHRFSGVTPSGRGAGARRRSAFLSSADIRGPLALFLLLGAAFALSAAALGGEVALPAAALGGEVALPAAALGGEVALPAAASDPLSFLGAAFVLPVGGDVALGGGGPAAVSDPLSFLGAAGAACVSAVRLFGAAVETESSPPVRSIG
jgi:hypothetical protein